MDEICPICNGLDEIKAYCSECKTPMDQIGRVEDNKGPYSPYMDADTFTNNNTVVLTGDNCCIHLYKCSACGSIYHRPVQLISV